MTEAVAHPTSHILIVDDDRELADLLATSLSTHGFRVSVANDGRSMDAILVREGADLVILDVMMPGESGLDLCRRLQREGGPPIVFLSALGDETDRIIGLELGAGHYLPKPCSSREVLATVRAALRRRGADDPPRHRDAFVFAGWRLDAASRELVDPEGVLVGLTDGEFSLLRIFLEQPRRIFSRDQLLEGVRGPSTEAFDRAVDVQVSRLRRKLRAPGDEMIRTIRSEGYMLAVMVARR